MRLQVFDYDDALHRCNGDEQRLLERLRGHLISAPHHLMEVCNAVARCDTRGLREATQRWKGTLELLSARRTLATILALERCSQSDALYEASGLAKILCEELDHFQAAIQDVLRDPSSPAPEVDVPEALCGASR